MPDLQDSDTPKNIEALVPLLALANRLGSVYGSDDISMFFYTLIRRERPRNIVELGTGLGVSTFWMAQALEELGEGQVWSVDDGSHWQDEKELRQVVAILGDQAPFDALPDGGLDYAGFITETAKLLGLSDRIIFANECLDLTDDDFLAKGGYPFLRQPVDLVFADITRGPDEILDVFFHFLPHMAESGSIFIDSASTSLSGYLFLENFIAQLNQSKVPRRFLMTQQPQRRRVLMDLVAIRRFTLMHLVERRARKQNSTAWIKIEPVDYVPHPMTLMKM
jgi:predicted O-methyltransferase YrrM